MQLVLDLLFNPKRTALVGALLLVWEAVFNVLIIRHVPYTEIDWVAYMEEVEGPLVHGEWDYAKLGGCTGHLPYPAGFVYVFAGLRLLTDGGKNILRAQYIFAGLHVALLACVFAIYRRMPRMPPYVLILLCLSHRVHSIFALRLFNDGVAMLLLYAAVLVFLSDYWLAGCVLFSAAVSIKMNVLLFAPGLLVLLLKRHGVRRTSLHLAVCAALQLALAVPFVQANAWSYISRSFNLGRAFEFKWTVNLKFLGEELFGNKALAAGLLAAHVAVLLVFARVRWLFFEGGFMRICSMTGRIEPMHVVAVLFSSNFIGIAFARTLHYQFLVWYFHTLPFLLWATDMPVSVALAIQAAIEYAFNVFPATSLSSAVLALAHGVVLVLVLVAPIEPPRPLSQFFGRARPEAGKERKEHAS